MGVLKVAYPGIEEHKAMGLEAPGMTAAYPQARTMTIPAPSASLDIEGIRSLEVRWIFAGRPTAAMVSWFGRFPAETITLEDAYLVDPHLPGLSVKVREGRALEVKAYHGSPGLLKVPRRARGWLEAWQKWSFPYDPAGPGGGHPACWRTVRKRRRISRFSRSGAPAAARAPGPGEEPGCAVELAEFRGLGADWWTLGFEATGPARALPGQLKATAAIVFDQVLQSEVKLDVSNSMSYARWLRSRLG
jgi:hypothetical protein